MGKKGLLRGLPQLQAVVPLKVRFLLNVFEREGVRHKNKR